MILKAGFFIRRKCNSFPFSLFLQNRYFFNIRSKFSLFSGKSPHFSRRFLFYSTRFRENRRKIRENSENLHFSHFAVFEAKSSISVRFIYRIKTPAQPSAGGALPKEKAPI
ncbi:hypothetical protein [uncultured Alistipes sp.]|uniref:hypothetical protein n=1 Tax=uncultured Alistipes sp. TaxID=538949 RepID=UPI001F9B4896|nr:hypothetical protein [uncultured Alistipes sp.]HJC27596.1 hypothetical protein [Candidatus Alistipes stercoravium]